MRYVIVGASAAGLAAAEAIVARDTGAEVLLVSEEERPPYCRPLISYWLAGESPESLFPLPTDVLSKIEFRPGCRATHLDTRARELTLGGGERCGYDRLLIATGADSKDLGLDGEQAGNVFGFRTWGDAAAIDGVVRGGARRAIVLGGGLVGVKAAHALVARGVETLVCVASAGPLSQVADRDAGTLAAAALGEEGIDVRTGYVPAGFRLEAGKVTGVRFERPGTVEACDLVIRGKGVAPRVDLFDGTGVDTRGGIPVDDRLRTPVADVWAAGDVVRCRDLAWGQERSNAIWPVAVEQGRAAGLNMAGADVPYAGSVGRNSVRIGKLHMVSAGVLSPPPEGYESRSRLLPRGMGYRKAVTRDGVLVGFISVEREQRGPASAGLFVSAVLSGTRAADLPVDPLEPGPNWEAWATRMPLPAASLPPVGV
ncbi:MAG TPA: FAD/NAD(P)-binding oxidoreductase [Deferrisomatales bacterium]|nr:FAD/NAD(P)-binding oxidoreductase [Deferrisomatales bacterium]